MNPRQIETLRVESDRVAAAFLDWFGSRRAKLPMFVAIEGLPYSGKSTLLNQLPRDTFGPIELDRFIKPPAGPDRTWKDCVKIEEVLVAIRIAQAERRIVAIEGPALWELAEDIFQDVPKEEIVRVYLKQMSRTGEYVDWLAGEMIDFAVNDDRLFFRSIWNHHSTRPWNQADLIIERLPEPEPD